MWWVKWWKIHSASLHVIGAKYSTVYSVKLSASSYNNPGWTGAVSGRLFWGQSCSLNCDGVVKMPIVVGGRLSCRDSFLQAATVICVSAVEVWCSLLILAPSAFWSKLKEICLFILPLDKVWFSCWCWTEACLIVLVGDLVRWILMENNSIRSSFFLWQLFGSIMHDNFWVLTDIVFFLLLKI